MTRRRRQTPKKPIASKKRAAEESDKSSSASESEEDQTKRRRTTKQQKQKKTTSTEERLTSSLQSFNSQSQSQAQEYDYEELFSSDYLDSKLSQTELTNRLKKLHLALKKYEQLPDKNSSPPWDNVFLESLLKRKVLHIASEEGSLYLACIFADLLRVIIPLEEWLHDDAGKMRQVFMHIIKNLKGLGQSNDSLSFTRFYLLERLSVSKLAALLTNEDMDAEGLIEELFNVFFEVVKDKETFIPQAVVYMEDIMVTIIEGSPVIPTSILKHLLGTLISKKQPIATQISKIVLHITAEYIAHPLNDQLNFELERQLDQEFNSKERASLFKSIVSLTLISSRLLLNTIPLLTTHLKSENLNIRSSVVQLFGTMFSHEESTLFEEYQELFKTFVDRSRDLEPAIRIYMIKFMQNMLINHGSKDESIRNLVNERLSERCLDTDEKVRRNACEAITNVMQQNIDLLNLNTIDQLKTRARDKKTALRIHVMKLISETWREHSGQGVKVQWIPNCVIHAAITVPNHAILETLLDQHLLAKDNPEDEENRQRALSFVTMIEQIDEISLGILKNYVYVPKNNFRYLLKKFISMGEQSSSIDEEADKRQLTDIILSLVKSIPDRDESTSIKFWEQIHGKKEVLEELKKALDPSTSLSDLEKIKEKLSGKKYLVNSKEIIDYIMAVFQKAASTIINKKQVKQIMNLYVENKEDTVLSALLFCAENVPYLFLDCYTQLEEMLRNSEPTALISTLKILLHAGKGIEEVSYDIASDMEPRLLELAQKGTPKEAKYAIRVISKVYVSPELLYEKIFKNLVQNLKYSEPEIEVVLSALSEIASHSSATFATKANKIVEFAINEIILGNREEGTSSNVEEISSQTRCRLITIKMLSNYIVAAINTGAAATNQDEIQARVVNLHWNLLEYEGNVLSYLAKDPKRPYYYLLKSKKIRKADKGEENRKQEGDVEVQYKEPEYSDSFGEFDAAMIRLACVKGLLDLASTSGHALTFTNDRYLRISYSILEPVPEVRKGVMHKLYSLLKTGRLGTRFLAILLLGVMDEYPNNATNAKKYIMEVIPQMRREIAAANVGNPPTLDSNGSYQIFPEYALPYLIYILAHHPDFASMAPDYIQFQKVLFTYFDVVTKNVDNVSFFNGLLAKIKTRRDVSNLDSQNHLIVCDLAVIILPRCVQGSNSIGAIYPGKYFIPNFFRPESESIAPITTPRRSGFDTSGVNETVIGSSTAMQHLRTLYLPKEFKLQERIARSIGIQQASPSVSVKSKKAPGKTTEPKKRKPRKSTTTPSKKPKKAAASKEVLPKRTPLPRSAKSSSKPLSDIEYSSEEMEEMSEEEEEERTLSAKKKLVFSSDSEMEQHVSSSEEEENAEPEISVTSRRRMRLK